MMKKKHLLITLLSITLLTLTGCQSVENWFKNAKEEWIGLEMTVRTYDENSQLIDQCQASPYQSRVTRNLTQLMRKEIPRKTHLCSKSPWVSMRLTMWALP